MPLYLLSGETGSGKTTALMNCFNDTLEVGGFLSPVKDNIRHFYLIRERTYLPMEWSESCMQSVLRIGKYQFDSSAFKQAINQFEVDWNDSIPLLILDEFGPLELNNEGLFPELNIYLELALKSDAMSILVIVRSSLKHAFLNLFPKTQIIDVENISQFMHGDFR